MQPAISRSSDPYPYPPLWYSCLAYLCLLITATSLVTIGLAHLHYPGFTETMEGDIFQHIERAARGEVLYPAPRPDYIPLTYMPLYDYLAAPFYLAFGDRFFGPRLLSFLATLGSAFWIWRITLKQTGSYPSAALALAIFCGSFRVMDASLFTVHPDSLLLFWILTGYWFWAYGRARRDDVLWLISFTLAFWTKQHGAIFFGWAVLYALLYRDNALPRWGILLGIFIGGPLSYVVVGSFMGERFWFHTLIEPTRWEQSWWLAMRRTIYVLCVLAPISFVAFLEFWRVTRERSWRPTPLVWFIATSLITSLYTMRISGTSNNHYTPLHALLSVSFAALSHRLISGREPARLHNLLLLMAGASGVVVYTSLQNFSNHPIPVFVPTVVAAACVGLIAVLWVTKVSRSQWEAAILICAQFAVLIYNPARYLPRDDFHSSLDRFRSELSRLDAPVIWVDYGGIPSDLTVTKLMRMPSWVALEDIERQQISRAEIEADLRPWQEKILGMDRLYLLSFDELKNVTVWKRFTKEFELVKDFGDSFAGVRQIADHWYGSGDAPRYLYRKIGEE